VCVLIWKLDKKGTNRYKKSLKYKKDLNWLLEDGKLLWHQCSSVHVNKKFQV